MEITGIDTFGLTSEDRKLLKCLYDNPSETIGIDTLSILLGEAPSTISSEIEPYLIQQGYLIRTSRGRVLTTKGVEYVESLVGIQT
jgi:Holliday junction DNA helicase RuvB